MTEGKSKEYQQGYEQGIKEFAERLKTYYNHLTVGSFPYLISDCISHRPDQTGNAEGG